ncbi:MAG: hypothetical protein JWO31_2572 [Phycisphaerales bacterium]|nr:hypothetical protein [Phycisphaerales bacterium]
MSIASPPVLAARSSFAGWPPFTQPAAPAGRRTPGLVSSPAAAVVRPARRRVPAPVKLLLAADLLLGGLYVLSAMAFRHWLPATWRVPADAAAGGAVEYKFQWLKSLFDLDAEQNIPTWFSSAQLLLVAALLGVFAWARFDRRRLVASAGLVAAAGLFAALSMDEVACLHENLGGKLVYYLKAGHHGSAYTLWAFWAAVGLPFAAAAGCIARASWSHWAKHRRASLTFLAGLIVFLGCAVGMELAWITFAGTNPSGSLAEVFAEEVGEMLGETIMVWGAWGLLAAERVTVSFGRER